MSKLSYMEAQACLCPSVSSLSGRRKTWAASWWVAQDFKNTLNTPRLRALATAGLMRHLHAFEFSSRSARKLNYENLQRWVVMESMAIQSLRALRPSPRRRRGKKIQQSFLGQCTATMIAFLMCRRLRSIAANRLAELGENRSSCSDEVSEHTSMRPRKVHLGAVAATAQSSKKPSCYNSHSGSNASATWPLENPPGDSWNLQLCLVAVASLCNMGHEGIWGFFSSKFMLTPAALSMKHVPEAGL